MEHKRYKMIFDSGNFVDSIEFDDLEGAKNNAIETLILWIFEECCQFSPVFVPGFENIRVLFVPFLTEFFPCVFCVLKIYCTVDLFQVCTDSFSVLVGNEFTAVAYLMHDAELVLCFREDSVYRRA